MDVYCLMNNIMVAVIKIDMMLTLLTDCCEETSHKKIRVSSLSNLAGGPGSSGSWSTQINCHLISLIYSFPGFVVAEMWAVATRLQHSSQEAHSYTPNI